MTATLARRSIRESLWLRVHGAGERSFARVLADYFASQAARIADAVAQFHVPGPSIVPQVFREPEELAALMRLVHPQLFRLTTTGAVLEWQLDDGHKSTQQNLPFGPTLAVDLPDFVVAAIRQFVAELEQQPYWRAIQTETSARLATILRHGLEDGFSHHQLQLQIREQLGGLPARARALTIARTETTGALNAGHQAVYEELRRGGLIAGKEWLAVLDGHTRLAHETISGTTVDVNDTFNVGGYPARWPGDFTLPGEQRINCRCTTLGSFC
ncbi:MAG: hypothetical protein JSS27_07225 [Planctomycetes bacterium]|nr:hypothetical protein [Planctomycetota bacterium]